MVFSPPTKFEPSPSDRWEYSVPASITLDQPDGRQVVVPLANVAVVEIGEAEEADGLREAALHLNSGETVSSRLDESGIDDLLRRLGAK